MVEEVTETQVGEGREIAGSRRGVFIDTSTPAMTEVGLVTTLEELARQPTSEMSGW